MEYLETKQGWWDKQIDFATRYTASGHSTGGRVILMLAALTDSLTHYLLDVPDIVSQITEAQQVGLQKFLALVGDYLSTFPVWPICFRHVVIPILLCSLSCDDFLVLLNT